MSNAAGYSYLAAPRWPHHTSCLHHLKQQFPSVLPPYPLKWSNATPCDTWHMSMSCELFHQRVIFPFWERLFEYFESPQEVKLHIFYSKPMFFFNFLILLIILQPPKCILWPLGRLPNSRLATTDIKHHGKCGTKTLNISPTNANKRKKIHKSRPFLYFSLSVYIFTGLSQIIMSNQQISCVLCHSSKICLRFKKNLQWFAGA